MKHLIRPFSFLLFLVAQTIFFRVAFFHESYYLIAWGGVVIASDIALFALLPKKQQKSVVLALTVPSVLLTAASFAIGIVLESDALKNLLVVVHAFLQGIYLLNTYYYFYRRESYQGRSLWHTTSTMNTVTFFFAASMVYATSYFLDIPIVYMIVPFLFLVCGLSAQTLFIHECSFREHRFFLVMMVATAFCVVLSLAWLPSNYYVNAALATVFYYVCSNIGILALRKELTKKEIRTYSVIALAVVFLVGATAQWR